MILILTDENDLHCDRVIAELAELNAKFIRLNLNKSSLLNTKATFLDTFWEIDNGICKFNTSEIKSVWNRRTYVELLLEEEYDSSPDFKIWKNEWNKTLLGIYYSIFNVYWLNNYRNSQKAENKYLQISLANKIGFTVPELIVSNDKNILIKFVQKHKSVALKLMYQDFYKVADNEYRGFYVNVLTEKDLDKLQDIGENPIVLQKYIEKDYEVRYTIVKKEHFVCRINSQISEKTKFDWRRYDIPNTPHSIIEAPKSIQDKVEKLIQELDLDFGALDFIVDKDGSWHFLEINPMGQYLWIEDLTGLQISKSIANLLNSNSK